MAHVAHAQTRPVPLSWNQIDADERCHGDPIPADAVLDDADPEDITDIAPLAPRFLRYPDHLPEDHEAEERRALLMSRGSGWPDDAAPSGRFLAALSLLVVMAVVALIGVTFAA